jgi:hypothetical protein
MIMGSGWVQVMMNLAIVAADMVFGDAASHFVNSLFF